MSLAMKPSSDGEIVAPRPAATVLLVRDGPEGLQVFMVVRHHKIDFASGALVFPGGKVEPEDHALAGGDAETASRVAAIRETYEECGVLLARAARRRRVVLSADTRPSASGLRGRKAGAGARRADAVRALDHAADPGEAVRHALLYRRRARRSDGGA